MEALGGLRVLIPPLFSSMSMMMRRSLSSHGRSTGDVAGHMIRRVSAPSGVGDNVITAAFLLLISLEDCERRLIMDMLRKADGIRPKRERFHVPLSTPESENQAAEYRDQEEEQPSRIVHARNRSPAKQRTQSGIGSGTFQRKSTARLMAQIENRGPA